MAQENRPEPRAFSFEGGAIGCLLIHGFTGSPPEMRLLGEYLHDKGLSVVAPLLPGHGTMPDDLNRVRWQDWVETVEQALLDLFARCELVFVGGLSMGALLTVHLAAMYPEIGGILLYSPALRAANRLLPLAGLARYFIHHFPKEPESKTDLTDPQALERLWHYETFPVGGASELYKLQKVVRAELGDVCVPALVFYSTRDKLIRPDSARVTFEKLGSEDKELVVLHNSGHCMTVDSEREEIFARTWGFIVAHSGGRLPQDVLTVH
ncbi:MAG: alpha/beta fold hydrolase [Anaerolineae bacterium]|nr:alpha/beta fold hydrolase [Anaerolineae bacterium]